ncbi:MAG: peptidylprolyl isomerase [Planctomycetaceae bacterium]|nr:peptidylprolyl isomerase [Planctomycetaceae bacterium]
MQRFSTLSVLAALVFCGCEGSGGTQADPPVPVAAPLKPGVIKMAPKGPEAPAPVSNLPKSPDLYRVKFETTKGDFVIEVHRDWAPNGSDRFHELVEAKFYDGVKFFRVIEDFMVQFGISGDPAKSAEWREKTIPDDPVVKSNTRGFVTFAKTGLPDSRTTQLFINFVDNSRLDSDGFAPFAEVVSGMDVVDALNKEYGATPSDYQPEIQSQGNAFLEQKFPNLDAVKTARLVKDEPAAAP